MAYVKTNWVDDVTPLSATNLNNIETGIESNSTEQDKMGKYTEITANYTPGVQSCIVDFTTEVHDDLNMWAIGIPDRIIIPAGVSLITVYGYDGETDVGVGDGALRKNGSDIARGLRFHANTSAIPVSTGDYIQMYHDGNFSGSLIAARMRVVIIK